jgi:hypothetical protein
MGWDYEVRSITAISTMVRGHLRFSYLPNSWKRLLSLDVFYIGNQVYRMCIRAK